MSKSTLIIALLVFFTIGRIEAQQTIPLYPGAIPNEIPTQNVEFANDQEVHFKVSEPTMGIYLAPAEIANGTAVVICPGGGYEGLWMKNEGREVAENMNKLGVTAFVLKYRLPSDQTMKDKTVGPLQDAQQAIQIVRENAKKWHVDPNKLGIMGFSAGGHLAATVATHFNKAYGPNPQKINLRPDFAILVYPVISFRDDITHQGSRAALLGKNPTEEQIALFSNEEQVHENTPPTFIVQAGDDKIVSVQNSIRFYEALLQKNIPASLHLFATGDHGFPLEPAHSHWFSYCAKWLQENKLAPELKSTNGN